MDVTPVHKGVLTALECPDIITDVPYHYPGDMETGYKLVQAGKEAGIPVVGVNDETYVWDYGTVVPLRYLVPKQDLPIIDLSVTLAASLEETYQWGRQIGKVLRENKKRSVFVSSGALSHNLVRGRENRPTRTEHVLDRQFISYLMNEQYESAHDMLQQYSKIAGVESGGRHLAMLFGVMEGSFAPKMFAEAQSSGSWNAIMTFEPRAAHLHAASM